jgi:hypothetical protein
MDRALGLVFVYQNWGLGGRKRRSVGTQLLSLGGNMSHLHQSIIHGRLD